ncbi:unnamed protein product [Rotaria sordida]|uniref:Tubulin-tyrosine ligase n=1 Tax=Rotaria sordida TaxID=392033 RepID=A0A819FB04_9BILA|nr:unnamed protein product [Rotaria sordida]CAF3864962.1 unnamed protein product [Rotaria sordida]
MFILLYPIVHIKQPYTEIFRNYVDDNTYLTSENCPELFSKNLQNNIEIFEKYHKCDLYDKIPMKIKLTDQHYQLIDNLDQANIIFTKKQKQILDFRHETLKNLFINQFLFENILTARRWKSLYRQKKNFQQNEILDEYCGDHQIDHTWIVKPINLTRSIDTSITNVFDMIIRLSESGSKLACKYVSNPFLLKISDIEGNRVKFDVRYILLLRSIRSLKLYVHKIFWLRYVNKPFSMKELDDHETHFTIMDYRVNTHIRQIDYETFITLFNEQRIFEMFQEIFHCVTIEEPPFGIGSYLSSRASYAADLILELKHNNKIQLKLLEINFAPDCQHGCTSYPTFYNQVFNILFRNLTDDEDTVDISS